MTDRLPVSYYPRDRDDAIRCLLMSGRALDDGDESMAKIYHRYARAYIDDHPDEFKQFYRKPQS